MTIGPTADNYCDERRVFVVTFSAGEIAVSLLPPINEPVTEPQYTLVGASGERMVATCHRLPPGTNDGHG